MSGLLYAGFDYGTTDDLPGIGWTTATNVEIVPGVGRDGGGAAFFDASAPSVLSAALTWTGSTAEKALTFMGFAFKLLSAGAAGITIAKIVTDNSVYKLRAYTSGVLELTQDAVLLQRVGPVFSLGHGSYIEWSVRLIDDVVNESRLSVRVNGKPVLTNVLGASIDAEAFESVALGGGTAETGTFYADDVYVLDGVARPALADETAVLTNAGFLGDVRVEALFPTGDGRNTGAELDAGYTSWTPSEGTTHYTMVNEQPPDGGATYEATNVLGVYNTGSHTLDKYDTFEFEHPHAARPGFGLLTNGDPAPLYAVQVISRMSTDAASSIKATARVVDDKPSEDHVNIGAARAVTLAAYTYKATIFDRDPALP